MVVGDGKRVQAQAGFSSGSDLRFNVEIDGSDSLRLVTPKGTQGFHIPAGDVTTVIGDALFTLIAGAKPYLSEVDPPSGAAPMQFQFIRGSTTLVSSVELPAPFKITSPASGTTLAITARTLPVRLTATAPATKHETTTFNCTDVNGNTASGTPGLKVVPGSASADSTGVSYSLDIGAAVDGLSFSTTHPRGAVARCDVVLRAIVEAQGQADPQFESAQIFAQQIRSVSFAMR
ncbi:hypothetical protein CKO43_03605 [Rubrivivax gelatinosus]|uniref:Uncharacterized protein n=1 Tax=Rubrivivax gelatinosus TaxID=28068 RepID=A0ABS1DQ67_RUBGE|nr:hypothetical protein [Rubrivivax gelatinosus]